MHGLVTSSFSFAAYFTTKISTFFFAFVLLVLFDWRLQSADSTFEVFHASTLLFQFRSSVFRFLLPFERYLNGQEKTKYKETEQNSAADAAENLTARGGVRQRSAAVVARYDQ